MTAQNTLPAALAALLSLLLVACGPTLQRGADGWKQEGAIYSVAPRPDGTLMPPTWKLANYRPVGAGFRKSLVDDMRDFELKRGADDGVLVIATESLDEDAAQKKVEVLLDRWLAAVVAHPQEGANGVKSLDDRSGLYDEVLPSAQDVATVQIGFRTASVREAGRNVQITRRSTFDVPNGAGAEVEAELIPRGATGPDRMLYVSVLCPRSSPGRMVVVAYGNTPTMFADGVGDASDLAHRIRF